MKAVDWFLISVFTALKYSLVLVMWYGIHSTFFFFYFYFILKTLYILQRTLSLSAILAIGFLGGLYGSFEDKQFVHFT